VTVVFASGLNAVIMELSQLNATGQCLPPRASLSSHFFASPDAGSKVESVTALDESPPPQAERRAPAAHVANNDDRAAKRILLQPVF
jgi:hypothetical protein